MGWVQEVVESLSSQDVKHTVFPIAQLQRMMIDITDGGNGIYVFTIHAMHIGMYICAV
jgi:hypothetical protein